MIKRIISWNNQRYPQVYCHNLQAALLEEEVREFEEAVLSSDRLDALADIVYVAIGAMWKLGLDHDGILRAMHIVCDSNDSKSATRTAPNVKANKDKGSEFIPPEPALRALLKEYFIDE